MHWASNITMFFIYFSMGEPEKKASVAKKAKYCALQRTFACIQQVNGNVCRTLEQFPFRFIQLGCNS